MPEKEHLNLVFVGHVDHGKSTILGRLFYDLGLVKELPSDEEAGTMKFAWLVDKLKEERERGLTIDIFTTKIETPHKYITIIDAPGHVDFIKNMITGASQADAALLVVSAKAGEGVQQQTREHIFLIRTLGINQLIVAINKMDEETVKYSQDRFEELKAEVSNLLKKVGYDVSKIPFVPTSGWEGDNVVKKSENMPWYKGPTIYELLDKLQPPPKPVDKPLRIPIQDVYTITGVGVVPVGRVESGVLKPNTKIIVEPIGETAEVKSIEMHHERLEQAVPGDNIGFNIKGIEKRKLKRGMVVGYPDNSPTVAKEFTAQIIVMQHPTAIAPGYTPVIHIHTATMACEIYEFVDKRDPKTGAVIEKNPKYLKAGDSAVVKMRPIKPLVVERFKDFPALGRFAIRDMGMTIGAGIVLEVVPVEKKSK